ncbi:hypothetical protein ACH4VR_29735 [Streptomyces sp. NPDC020883]|uniref:hypothetical protein n=1 Tax=Streptomyces sp. NPDC020883 TaxID=3365099 RepID=UPI00378CB095
MAAPVFSAAAPAVPGGNVPGGERLPAPRAATAAPRSRRANRQGTIAQRVVPPDLQPVSLRDELIDLGDAFRAYQSSEPDLALLAGLHDRKARAFTTWAEVTGDGSLRAEARRAEQAAASARLQHEQRTGQGAEGAVERVLTSPTQWEHARAVLAYVQDHAPVPGPEGRLLALMLTLRTARSGSGNVTGQDLAGWPLGDTEGVLREVVDTGWLRLPGTVADLLASSSDNPTHLIVPSLLPHDDGHGPLGFGKTTRNRLSGWGQKVVGERNLRKKKVPAAGRLLALACAAHSSADGRLGPCGRGLEVDTLTRLCAVDAAELGELVEQLNAAEWLTDVSVTDTHVTGRLCERVLGFNCPVSAG